MTSLSEKVKNPCSSNAFLLPRFCFFFVWGVKFSYWISESCICCFLLLFCVDVTRENDWTCPKCGNVNFSFRTVCNMRKCNTPRPASQVILVFSYYFVYLFVFSPLFLYFSFFLGEGVVGLCHPQTKCSNKLSRTYVSFKSRSCETASKLFDCVMRLYVRSPTTALF